MSWSLRLFLPLLVSALLLPVAFLHAAETTTVGAKNCDIIDLNWHPFGERILGANTKISDVMLNACEAIGGREQCNFTSGCRYEVKPGTDTPANATAEARRAAGCTPNHGASESQHMQDKALDVVVTPGKEKEFMTLAICGLRKVNNCQGGVGYYKNKSIHVDVRENRTNVWSTGYHFTDIATNVKDAAARSILYGFGSGDCVTGSIASESGEKEIYGEPEKYTPPEGYPEEFMLLVQPIDDGSLTDSIQAMSQSSLYTSLYGFFQPLGSAFSGSETTSSNTGTLIVGNSNTGSTNGETLDYSVADTGASGSLGDTLTDGGSLSYTPDSGEGTITKVVCDGSGLFGTSLFQTCNTVVIPATNAQGGSTSSSGLSANSETNSSNATNNTNDAIYTTNTSPVRTATGKAIDVFYGVYNPEDASSFTGGTSQGSNLDNYGQFLPGEVVPVTEQKSDIVNTSVKFTEQSVLYGSYYGLIHGVSPMLIGSAPRTLLRIGQQAIGGRVYNPFSI